LQPVSILLEKEKSKTFLPHQNLCAPADSLDDPPTVEHGRRQTSGRHGQGPQPTAVKPQTADGGGEQDGDLQKRGRDDGNLGDVSAVVPVGAEIVLGILPGVLPPPPRGSGARLRSQHASGQQEREHDAQDEEDHRSPLGIIAIDHSR